MINSIIQTLLKKLKFRPIGGSKKRKRQEIYDFLNAETKQNKFPK